MILGILKLNIRDFKNLSTVCIYFLNINNFKIKLSIIYWIQLFTMWKIKKKENFVGCSFDINLKGTFNLQFNTVT